ncbi:MAG: hypothetical protein U9P72_12330 [Campylobacterota bacterium]|nr:hypothetical protein [Campylobacterota bacterium]
MKLILTFLLLLTGLFAHGTGENHLHFFSSLHAGDFILLLVGLVAGLSMYKYFNKETN